MKPENAVVVSAAVFFAIGVYLGKFIGEADVVYSCEKDRAIAISGAFWKDGIKYSCAKVGAQQAKGEKK